MYISINLSFTAKHCLIRFLITFKSDELAAENVALCNHNNVINKYQRHMCISSDMRYSCSQVINQIQRM